MPPENDDTATNLEEDDETGATPTDESEDGARNDGEGNPDPAASGDDPDPAGGDEGDDSGDAIDPEVKKAQDLAKSLRDKNAQTGRENASLKAENDKQKARIAELEAGQSGVGRRTPQQQRNRQTQQQRQQQRRPGVPGRRADGINRGRASDPGSGDVRYIMNADELAKNPADVARQLLQNDHIQRGAMLELIEDVEEEKRLLKADRQKLQTVLGRFRQSDAENARKNEIESMREMGLDDETAEDVFNLESTGDPEKKRAARLLLLNDAKKADERKAQRQQQLEDQQRVVGASGAGTGVPPTQSKGLKSDVGKLKDKDPEEQMDAIGKLVETKGEAHALRVMNELGITL